MRRFKFMAVVMTLGASLATAGFAGVAVAHGSSAPTITSATPDVGPLSGGTVVLITGKNLQAVTNGDVFFGSTEATDVIPRNAHEFHAITPAGAPGAVSISVTINSQTATLDNGFTYENLPSIQHVVPDRGPSAGGNRVQINGAGFTGATAVDFGSVAATSFQVDSDQAITAIAPAEPSKTTVEVTVATPAGTSPVNENGANDYTFVSDLPEVTSVAPDFGLTTGGQSVTITGFGFIYRGEAASAVDFGGVGAESFTVVNNNTIDATSPADTGTVDVTVTTGAGISSPNPPVDSFYYLSSYSS
ncbi:MAG TPA: IPT/TIG domain-containing protein [Acidimicrobiales bacterium]|nr:IPT/TIG domain-containing protein [Acidimicrobiales bacterium]